MKKPVLLLIRDGWGINPAGRSGAEREGDATLLASTPVHDRLYKKYPMSRLQASGLEVGLPEGQMGNSEVGHLNLGAGRIVYQELTRINLAVADGSLGKNRTLQACFEKAKGKRLHLIGLVSNGGVHSNIDHLLALIQLASESGHREIYIHAITDGRDCSPTSAREFISQLESKIASCPGATLATLVGRYYAMDRDRRWERVKLARDLFVEGQGIPAKSATTAIAESYAKGTTDEFITPICFIESNKPLIRHNDVLFFFNFRADRMRQIVRSLADPEFSDFQSSNHPKVHVFTMTPYESDFKKLGIQHLFTPLPMNDLLGEVVAAHGLSQARLAETENILTSPTSLTAGRKLLTRKRRELWFPLLKSQPMTFNPR